MAATQKERNYEQEFLDKNTKQIQDRIAEQQKANTNISNQYVTDINTVVDKNIENSVNKVQGQINTLPTQYQSSFDANAVQQKINERQVAERMANMGLTNSGLNRTQQTAINIQRSNADAALRQQMNAATVSLKQQIADLYASGESQKAENSAKARYELAQKNQAVYDTGMNNLYAGAEEYANTMYKAESDAAIEAAKLEYEKQKYLDEQAHELELAEIKAAQNTEANKLKLKEDYFDEAYELYDPNNENAFYDYIEKLELLGYSEDVLAELVTYVISKKGKSVQRAWQGPIYQPNTTKQDETKSTKTTTKNLATTWKGWSGLW